MKKKSGSGVTQVSQTNIFGLLWRSLKGIWGSFSRFMSRSLNPSTGKRPSTGKTPSTGKYESTGKLTVNQYTRANPLHVSPLVGVRNSHNIESVTVETLFATVRWQIPIQAAAPTVSTPTVSSVKDQISWD
jgi:hypothetical protein